ncbi:N-acetylmuramoyl-L-alanine amidase [Streptomyces sp. JNUCC 64]
MRGFLASSIGVTCAVALTFPLTLPAGAQAAPRGTDAPPPGPRTLPAAQRPADPSAVPGATQSLPLAPPATDRSRTPDTGDTGERVLTRRTVRPFSLLGVIWDDVGTELEGDAQVRTRSTGTGTWTGWRSLDTHGHDHAADPDTAEARSGRVRGATAPLWVGDSDGVEVRVTGRPRAKAPQGTTAPAPLPAGLRLELVDPGPEPAPAPDDRDDDRNGDDLPGPSGASYGLPVTPGLPGPDGLDDLPGSSGASGTGTGTGTTGVPGLTGGVPGLTGVPPYGTFAPLAALTGEPARASAAGYTAPRPAIVTRRNWGADESLRESGFVYTGSVKAAFVHHSATGNTYTCAQAPSVIRGIYRYHVQSSGWRDIGYNFLVDKCGSIYEGRAGGVGKAVLGAHTLGFNSNTMGIAVLGSYGTTTPSSAAVKAVAKITAWKLGLYGANPRGKTYLTSGGGNLYRKGKKVRLHVISGHRDGFATECPGARLYGKLGTARSTAARLQGR